MTDEILVDIGIPIIIFILSQIYRKIISDKKEQKQHEKKRDDAIDRNLNKIFEKQLLIVSEATFRDQKIAYIENEIKLIKKKLNQVWWS